MMQSLFAGVSGLRSHQRRMDVIGNNVANVNTVGFKAARATFQDVLYNTLRGAGAPQEDRGGTNPMQVGLGVQVGSIDTLFTPGNPQSTGVETDLMIQGEGLFIVSDGERQFYTRAGNFYPDAAGNLVTPGGYVLMGYAADATGKIGDVLEPLRVDKTAVLDPRATERVTLTGNLDASSKTSEGSSEITLVGVLVQNGEAYTIRTTVYDQHGLPHALSLTFDSSAGGSGFQVTYEIDGRPVQGTTHTLTFDTTTGQVSGGGTLSIQVDLNGDGNDDLELNVQLNDLTLGSSGGSSVTVAKGDGGPALRTPGTVIYDSKGNPHEVYLAFAKDSANPNQWYVAVYRVDPDDPAVAIPISGFGNSLTFTNSGRLSGTNEVTVQWDPGNGAERMNVTFNFDGVTQFAGESTAKIAAQDGSPMGTLERFAFDSNGVITGYYSNGLRRALGQVALAIFANPGGLERRGESLFAASPNSGIPNPVKPNTGGAGSILPSTLEMSNVDLAQEFTEMILTQRGYQANSRVITTSDEMLQELVNLKR